MGTDVVASVIAADKATTEAATSGPWTFVGMDCHEHNPYVEIGSRDSTNLLNADADFIAAARNRWPLYIAAIEAVTALHRQFTDDEGDGCTVCGGWEWPCPTIRALAVLAPSTPNKEQQ